MSIEKLRESLPTYAKDIKLNLGNIMTTDGAPGLTINQIYGIALASAYATQNNEVINSIYAEAMLNLTENELEAAKSSSVIMAMNNIYYRFAHLSTDKSYLSLPAKLRMNVIANPGINKIDFELYCLAVSIINGCGMCMDAHMHELTKEEVVTKVGIQSVARIAAVINATGFCIAI